MNILTTVLKMWMGSVPYSSQYSQIDYNFDKIESIHAKKKDDKFDSLWTKKIRNLNQIL